MGRKKIIIVSNQDACRYFNLSAIALELLLKAANTQAEAVIDLQEIAVLLVERAGRYPLRKSVKAVLK
jgi:hypothetical protein